jgi:hypothetical protein
MCWWSAKTPLDDFCIYRLRVRWHAMYRFRAKLRMPAIWLQHDTRHVLRDHTAGVGGSRLKHGCNDRCISGPRCLSQFPPPEGEARTYPHRVHIDHMGRNVSDLLCWRFWMRHLPCPWRGQASLALPIALSRSEGI